MKLKYLQDDIMKKVKLFVQIDCKFEKMDMTTEETLE